MSKFESSIIEGKFLEIDWADADGDIGLVITKNGYAGSITLSGSDVPALMVELARAAGLDKMTGTEVIPDSFEDHMMNAILSLEKAIGARQDAEAAAKEQAELEAELEAEALALMNSYLEATGKSPMKSFNDNHYAITRWKTVARKAREMRGDK